MAKFKVTKPVPLGQVWANSDAVFQFSPTVVAPAVPLGANVVDDDLVDKRGSIAGGPPWSIMMRGIIGGTATTITTSSVSDPLFDFSLYTDQFWIGAPIEFWRISNGNLAPYQTGTVVSYTNTSLTFSGGSGVTPRNGDMVILRKQITHPQQAYANASIVNTGSLSGFRLAPFGRNLWDGQDPNDKGYWSQTGGEWHIRYELTLSAVSTRSLGLLRWSGPTQSFYPLPELGKVYRFEVEMQTEGASAQFRAKITTNTGAVVRVVATNGVPGVESFPKTLTATTTRQVFTVDYEFTSLPTTSGVTFVDLEFFQAGTFKMYEFRHYDTSAEANGMTAETRARYTQAGLNHIRDHTLVKTDDPGKAYDLYKLIRSRLHSILTNVVSLGIKEFWLQPEFYMISQAAEFVEYLCGTTGPWAALRVSLGRTAPWTDDILFHREDSNETWNALKEFFSFPAMIDVEAGNATIGNAIVYGKFFDRHILAMKAAPAWSAAVAAKFNFIIGGRHNDDYGDLAAAASPNTDMVVRAPYIGGWEVAGDGTSDSPQGFAGILGWPATKTISQMASSETWLATARATGAKSTLKAGTYEDAMSFSALPPDVFEFQKRVCKTVGGATAYIDKIAIQARQYSLQTHFIMGEADDWASHHPATGERYAYWQWVEEWNNRMDGSLHQTVVRKNRLRNQFVDGVSYTNVEELACHITSKGTRRCALIVNRNLPYSALPSTDALYNAADDGSRVVRLRHPWSGASSLKLRTMNGDYKTHNWRTKRVLAYQPLAFDGGTLPFTAGTVVEGLTDDYATGALVTGATSGATGQIYSVTGATDVGTLNLTKIKGNFQNNENLIFGGQVCAVANGTPGSEVVVIRANDDPNYAVISISETTLSVPTGDLVVTVPPASARLYIFEGVAA